MLNLKKYKINPSTKKGASLMEMIMLIAIIGIMSAVSIASLVTARINSELESSAEEVVAVLKEAQNYSLTGKDLSSACTAYTVSFVVGSSNYALDNGGASCPLHLTYVLKNKVTVSVAGNTSFVAPFGDVGATRTVITKSGASYTICVNSAGRVIKLSGDLACPAT